MPVSLYVVAKSRFLLRVQETTEHLHIDGFRVCFCAFNKIIHMFHKLRPKLDKLENGGN